LKSAASSGWTFRLSLSTGPEINRKDGEEFQMRRIARRAKEGRQIDPRVRAWFYSESWAELENVLGVSAFALLRNVAIAVCILHLW
jgi:hypothetical protein